MGRTDTGARDGHGKIALGAGENPRGPSAPPLTYGWEASPALPMRLLLALFLLAAGGLSQATPLADSPTADAVG